MNFIPSRIFVTIFTMRMRDRRIDKYIYSCVPDVHNIWIFNVRFTSEAEQKLKKKCTKKLKQNLLSTKKLNHFRPLDFGVKSAVRAKQQVKITVRPETSK